MFLLFPKNSSAAKEKEEYIIYVYSMKYTEHTKSCGNHCEAWPLFSRITNCDCTLFIFF